MKYVLAAIAIGIASFFAESLGPWWSGVALVLIAGFIMQFKTWPSFMTGFLAIGGSWCIATVLIDQANNGLLSGRIGEMFGGLSGSLIIVITVLIGGILGGLAMTTGSLGMHSIVGKRR